MNIIKQKTNKQTNKRTNKQKNKENKTEPHMSCTRSLRGGDSDNVSMLIPVTRIRVTAAGRAGGGGGGGGVGGRGGYVD